MFKLLSYKDLNAILKWAKERRPKDIYINSNSSQSVCREVWLDIQHLRAQGKDEYISLKRIWVRCLIQGTGNVNSLRDDTTGGVSQTTTTRNFPECCMSGGLEQTEIRGASVKLIHTNMRSFPTYLTELEVFLSQIPHYLIPTFVSSFLHHPLHCIQMCNVLIIVQWQNYGWIHQAFEKEINSSITLNRKIITLEWFWESRMVWKNRSFTKWI